MLRNPATKRAIRSATRNLTNRPENSARTADSPAAESGASRGGDVLSATDDAVVYDVSRWGMPEFRHAPNDDGDADPGEVVWTWVPFEDDPSQGKDRPVIALARRGNNVVFAQMTSKDHDRDNPGKPDHLGRVWFDIGTGPWDRKGRESEVRIDRLLIAHKDSIRREGAVLDKTRFTQLVDAIEAYHS